jgi:NAD(P)-dependent dehydrogenase (short-subunit alcohol dehydrogenase family)
MEIRGTVSVVTGGTRGIGKSTALKLAELGSDIAIIYNTRDDLAKEVQSIIGLTQALAAEFNSKGILVNAVAPEPVNTDLVSGLGEEALKNLEKLSPIGRFTYPEEIAHAIVFLIENDYVSGEVLNINAGRYMN